MHKYRFFNLLLLIFHFTFAIPLSLAWDNHFYGTSIALSEIEELKNAPVVEAENLEGFLNSIASNPNDLKALTTLLAQIERWAQKNIPQYQPLPPRLELQSTGDLKNLKQNFLSSIRVNPTLKFALFLQNLPEERYSKSLRLEPHHFTLFPNSIHKSEQSFRSLKRGEKASLVSVISTASDEPDYGLDTGLWEDNGTPFGALYGFGKQPFGNPRLEYSSQAPFHMAFLFENKIVEAAAPFIKNTYPKYRFYLFQNLSQFAFEKGHRYWGARFLGWALHYLQDLTQPYHSTLMPGASTLSMLSINGLVLLGFPRLKNEGIQVLTNHHLALENYGFHFFYDFLSKGKWKALSKALQSEPPEPLLPATDFLKMAAKESHGLSVQTQTVLTKTFPEGLISNPHYFFGETDPTINTFNIIENESITSRNGMRDLLISLQQNFVRHSRAWIRSQFN